MGSLGKSLDGIFTQLVTEADPTVEFTKHVNYADDVKRFCDEYQEDRLWDQIPGRAHNSFQEFKLKYTSVPRPAELKQRLIKYSKKLDTLRLLQD